jgi:hypothetical protein
MKTCLYHADRPAVGLCVQCRSMICAGCCTRLDGINHCHACVKRMAARPVKTPGRVSSVVSATVVLAGGALALLALLAGARGTLTP